MTAPTLKIEYVPISRLKPYKGNARKHSKADVEAIADSIRRYGFNDAVGVYGDALEIVEGHGRVLAAKKLGMETVPIVRLDHMTGEERRAYAIQHNRTAELSEWDWPTLKLELDALPPLDLSGLEFDLDPKAKRKRGAVENRTDPERDPIPRLQRNVFENFERDFDPVLTGKYDIPCMEPTRTTGTDFLRFCDWKDVPDVSGMIAHFFYDDYKFFACWSDPDKYLDRLKDFKAVVAPDFSLYTDFPLALQILSVYRRQWIGAYWQSQGLDVIPAAVWGDERSYDFCFDGFPKRSTIAVSSVGVKADREWNGADYDLFRRGYEEMTRRLEPETVLYYGDMIDGIEGNIIRIPSFYEQKRPELNERARRKRGGRDGQRQ